MNRIFISYKRADKNRVFLIQNRIEAVTGEQCWIDLEGIESDAQFVNVIMRAIDEADIFLFMFSKAHAKIDNFENDWTVREINYAQKKKKRIVFVNLDQTPMNDWFEFMFGLKQQVDATNDQAIDHLARDICKWLNIKPQKPKQKPEPERIVEKVVEKQVVYVSKDDTYLPLGVAIVRCFRKYKQFQGRASRSEFWWWIFFRTIVMMNAFSSVMLYDGTLAGDIILNIMIGCLWILLLLPTLAVWTRRIHDTNRSGWWVLCPGYNIVLAFMDGQRDANAFGEVEYVDIRTENPLWQSIQRKWIPFVVILLVALWMVIFVMAVSKDSQPLDETVAPDTRPLVEESPMVGDGQSAVTYTLAGLIGSNPVHMVLDENLNGHYHYDRYPQGQLELHLVRTCDCEAGEALYEPLDGCQHVDLQEYSPAGKNSGEFSGAFYMTSDSVVIYNGTFRNKVQGVASDFMLKGDMKQAEKSSL